VSTPDPAPPSIPPKRSRVSRTFKGHFLAYLLVNAVLTGINIYTGAPWWAVWPLLVWGLLVMLHYLVYRAGSVEDAWVEERTLDLRSKSYDMGHIDDIRKHPAPSIGDKASGAPPPGKR
jgi:hypothetical protein